MTYHSNAQEYMELLSLCIAIRYAHLAERIAEMDFSSKEMKNIAQVVSMMAHSTGSAVSHPRELYMIEQCSRSSFYIGLLCEFWDNQKVQTMSEHDAAVIVRRFQSISYRKELIAVAENAIEAAREGHVHYAVGLMQSVRHPSSGEFYESAYKVLDTLATEEPIPIIRTGLSDIDTFAAWQRKHIVSFIGDTGAMKTRFSLWLLLRILSINESMRGIFISKELPTFEIYKLICSMGVFEDMSRFAEMSLERKKDVVAKVQENIPALQRLLVLSPSDVDSVNDVASFIIDWKADVWVLDYLSLIGEYSSSNNDPVIAVMSAIRKLRSIVHSTNSLGIVINQSSKGLSSRKKLPMPTLDDIEWSSDVKKLSSWVYALYSPALYNTKVASTDNHTVLPYIVHSLKNRTGKLHTMAFEAAPQFCQFEQVERQSAKYVALLQESQLLSID